MARLIPLILIALGVWFWLRAKRKTTAYMASYESGGQAPGARDARRDHDHREPQDPAA